MSSQESTFFPGRETGDHPLMTLAPKMGFSSSGGMTTRRKSYPRLIRGESHWRSNCFETSRFRSNLIMSGLNLSISSSGSHWLRISFTAGGGRGIVTFLGRMKMWQSLSSPRVLTG